MSNTDPKARPRKVASFFPPPPPETRIPPVFFICSACLFLFTCVSVCICGTASVNWAFIKLSWSQLSASLNSLNTSGERCSRRGFWVKIAQRGASTSTKTLCSPPEKQNVWPQYFPVRDIHPPKGYKLIVADPSIALSPPPPPRAACVFGRRSMRRIGPVELQWQMLTRVFRCDLRSG